MHAREEISEEEMFASLTLLGMSLCVCLSVCGRGDWHQAISEDFDFL